MAEKKFCKFCGEQIDKSIIVCPKCGRQLEIIKEELPSVIQEQQSSSSVDTSKPKFYEQEWMMWLMLVLFSPIGIIFMFKFNKRLSKKTKILLSIIFGLIFLIITFSEGTTGEETKTSNSGDTIIEDNKITETTKTNYTFNEMFKFDNLEITIGSDYTFTTVDNKFSDYYQKDIVKIPVTVKNISDETHSLNMFYYSIFGASGAENANPSVYFDDSIDYAGDLRSGGSYTKYFYVLYDGNGTYAIEFNSFFDEKTVEFEIKK